MKVLDTRVLVQVEKSNTCTQKIGGIEIPMNNGEYEVADVIEVGENVNKEVLAPGMKVYIYTGSGKKFYHEGKEYRVIAYNEIIVVL